MKQIKHRLMFGFSFLRSNLEFFFWIFGVLYLWHIDPHEVHHPTLCVSKIFGWGACIGCGFGRSIAFLLEGDVVESVRSHPLGIIGIVIILGRVITLGRLIAQDHYREI